MANKKKSRQTLQERLNIPYNLYHTGVSILIGVAAGLVIILVVGLATWNSRPTQYTLLLIRDVTGLDFINNDRRTITDY